ncbi:MAG: hypothetical protein ABL308_00045 [Oceanicaulis sp.]
MRKAFFAALIAAPALAGCQMFGVQPPAFPPPETEGLEPPPVTDENPTHDSGSDDEPALLGGSDDTLMGGPSGNDGDSALSGGDGLGGSGGEDTDLDAADCSDLLPDGAREACIEDAEADGGG